MSLAWWVGFVEAVLFSAGLLLFGFYSLEGFSASRVDFRQRVLQPGVQLLLS